jgi:GR25 family glycosyltransferase involved in LPS biosynthesis
MIEVPHIYCVSLTSSIDRRNRMIQRFKHHNLLEQTTFIDGVPWKDSIIDRYNYGREGNDINDPGFRKGMGCFLGHLKAIRTFVETSTDDGALIFEDDVLLRNNFREMYDGVWRNMPDKYEPTLISIGYMIENWTDTQSIGKLYKEGLFTISSKFNWGCQGYWISRDYAKRALDLYDRPFKILDDEGIFRSSEVVIRQSKGVYCVPPLCIEEGVDSERAEADLPYHHNHFSHWGYNNYSASELVHVCPFANR